MNPEQSCSLRSCSHVPCLQQSGHVILSSRELKLSDSFEQLVARRLVGAGGKDFHVLIVWYEQRDLQIGRQRFECLAEFPVERIHPYATIQDHAGFFDPGSGNVRNGLANYVAEL